ncbi:MAG TPA: SAM-dependent methyltransferase [Acidimicrobiales bacterium]|nr:SAM-dependent methyltransferase [Acidimicrobiales bacterium]
MRAPALTRLTDMLARAGCVAADEEAAELFAAADGERSKLISLVHRRLRGEPLAWVTGQAAFGELVVTVEPGTYVPRWQSQELVSRAAARLPEGGRAIDLCTGTGAIAAALRLRRRWAHIVATDIDPGAVACARANGVDARRGDLFEPVPVEFEGATHVVVAVVPYVPTSALQYLPHDARAFEVPSHYHGGPDGTDLLRRVVENAPSFLRPGGTLLLELGGEQAGLIGSQMRALGYSEIEVWADEDGDVRGIEATLLSD